MKPRDFRELVEALAGLPEEALDAASSPLGKRNVFDEIEIAHPGHLLTVGNIRRTWTRLRCLVLLEELGLIDDAEERHKLRAMLSRRRAKLNYLAPLDELVAIALDRGCAFS